MATKRGTATSNEASGSGDAQINFGASRSILVHPDRFYGYPNDDVIDWFASFERIARANKWDTAKCGRMVRTILRRYQKKKRPTTKPDASSEIIEMTAREHFILGLRPKLMNRVTMADPKTFSDAIRIALREESREDSKAINVVNHENDQQRDQMTEIIGLLGKLLKKEDVESQRKYSGRRNNKMANENVVSEILLCGPSSVVTGYINDTPANILVDTGASMSIVNESFQHAHLAHIPIKAENVNATSVTGEPVVFKGVLSASLKIGKNVAFQDFYVFSGFQHDCVLGNDFVTRVGVTIDMSERLLKWNSETTKMISDASDFSWDIKLLDKLEIPPRSQCLVKLPVNSSCFSTGLFEMSDSLYQSSRALAARSIVRPEQGEIPIMLVNPGMQAVTLEPRTAIGKVMSVTDIHSTSCNNDKTDTSFLDKIELPAVTRIFRLSNRIS
eukprot:gene14869-16415_t